MKSDKRAESYEVLLNDIATLYEEKVGMGIRQRNEQLVVSYWEIGDRIVSGEKSAGITARYGKKLIPQLSADLTERFGNGFGETNIFEIRRFRLEYSRKDLHPLLTWAHYRALMSVRDVARREELEAQTIAERLSHKKLKALARLTNGMLIAENRKDLLTPRKGRPYLYKVVSETLNGKKSVLLDCGFQVKRGCHGLYLTANPQGRG